MQDCMEDMQVCIACMDHIHAGILDNILDCVLCLDGNLTLNQDLGQSFGLDTHICLNDTHL